MNNNPVYGFHCAKLGKPKKSFLMAVPSRRGEGCAIKVNKTFFLDLKASMTPPLKNIFVATSLRKK